LTESKRAVIFASISCARAPGDARDKDVAPFFELVDHRLPALVERVWRAELSGSLLCLVIAALRCKVTNRALNPRFPTI